MPDANALTIGMMAVLAQYERELISERTKSVLTATKSQGIKLGNPQLSAMRTNDTGPARLAKQHAAAERNIQLRLLIAEIERETGLQMSLVAIAESLNNAGYTTARGKRFTKTQVYRIKSNNDSEISN